MNTKRSVGNRMSIVGLLAGAVACAAVAAMPGCELLVDFDRSKIPGGPDASLDDGSTGDDGATEAASSLDAGSDGGDGGPGAADTGADATVDGAADSGELGSDASDAAASDATTDASSDAELGDAAPDAGD